MYCKQVAFIQNIFAANHRSLRLQRAHEHRVWQVDWHNVVFSDESRYNLWDQDGFVFYRGCAGRRCLPDAISNNIVAELLEVWFGARFHIMDDPICHELRVISMATYSAKSVKCYIPK